MPKLINSISKRYRRKQSGQAMVNLEHRAGQRQVDSTVWSSRDHLAGCIVRRFRGSLYFREYRLGEILQWTN